MTDNRHNMQPVLFLELGSLGAGQIDPDSRINNGEQPIDVITITEVCEALTGDTYFVPTAQLEAIPGTCVDGRLDIHRQRKVLPSAAGGTFTMVVADALTTNRYRQSQQNAAEHAQNVYAFILEDENRAGQVGGHDAEHPHGEHNSGCGACDNLATILGFIRDRGDDIRELIEQLGYTVDEDTHRHIVGQAAKLCASDYAVSGDQLRAAMVEQATEASIETLTGKHNEVALVVNLEPNTTLDHKKLADDFGEAYEAFNLDVPALETAVSVLSLTKAEADAKLLAMLYYNVATAGVLAGPSLRFVVHQPRPVAVAA